MGQFWKVEELATVYLREKDEEMQLGRKARLSKRGRGLIWQLTHTLALLRAHGYVYKLGLPEEATSRH